MNLLTKMPYRKKLWFLVLFLLTGQVVTGILFITSMRQTHRLQAKSAHWFKHAYCERSLSLFIEQYDRLVTDHIRWNSKTNAPKISSLKNNIRANLATSLNLAKFFDQDEVEEEQEIAEAVEELFINADKAISLSNLKDNKNAYSFYTEEILLSKNRLLTVLKHRIEEEENGANAAHQESQRLARIIMFGGVCFFGFFSLGSLAATTLLTLSFQRKFSLFQNGLKKIREGDLRFRLAVAGDDEFAHLSDGFNQMTEELQKAQQMLIQSEKMSAIGRMMGGVAHEINNPLGVIMGFAQSMATRLPADSPFEKPIHFILNEATRCKDIVSNLLLFSRTSNVEKKDEVDMETLMRETLVLLRVQGRANNITLKTYVEKNLPRIKINKTQIQQVLLNLSNNAIDAMSREGTLSFYISLQYMHAAPSIVMDISDTGSGIPPSVLNHIFEPFFTTKDPGKGTGLGLSLVYQIIERHHGTIEVKSELNKGTTFHIVLPLREQAFTEAVNH